MKRAQGQSTQAYIVVGETTQKVEIIMGQSNLSESHVNNLQEVTALKEAGVEETDNVVFVQRSDGTRDVTWTITVVKAANSAEASTQVELLKKLQTKQDTSTRLFIGDTAPAAGEDKTVMGMPFTGTEYTALVGGVSFDYEAGSDVSGTIELSNSGAKPIEHDGTKMFSEILTGA